MTAENENKSMRKIIKENFGFTITDDMLVKSKKKSKSPNMSVANEEALLFGEHLLESMSEEELDHIGSKWDTLHLIDILGLASIKSNRSIGGYNNRKYKDTSTPVGVKLKTDITIQVPVIDVIKNKDTGIDPEKDISYRTVQAGEEFVVTYYEFMYLITRDEYGGFLKVFEKDFYAQFSPKLTAFWRGDAKLPTPTINYPKGRGSVKANIVDIDEKGPDGWVIKDEYKRFAPLVKNKKIRKSSKKSNKKQLSFDEANIIALGLQDELGLFGSHTGNKSTSTDELLNRGKQIIASMNNERKELIGNKSPTLHLIHLLGFESKNLIGSRPIGVTLVSDEDIEVPVIDILKNKDTGIDPATEISYRTVKAGEQFDISNYEFMYLILRDEYAGFCEWNGEKKGAYFDPNLITYIKGKTKLPVPKISVQTEKNPSILDIHQRNSEGILEIKPQYADKFRALLE